MYNLCWETTIRKGNIFKKLANDAPAPSRTKRAGKAQHINVEDDANSDKKLAV
tara:strand:+ start:248 stop:406 length:159 start_codon:yes stop_codon:yes gene_type:complete